MKPYINIETGVLYTRQELEDAHRDPYVSFPDVIDDEVLIDFGYANVTVAERPVIAAGQSLSLGSVLKIDNKFMYTWIIVDRVVDRTEIDAERDRRIDSGFEFMGCLIQSRPTDRENITGAVQLALMAKLAGAQSGDYRWSNPDVDFQWITSENNTLTLDVDGVIELGKTAAAVKQTLIFKGRELKDMLEIPSDFTDDKWWT